MADLSQNATISALVGAVVAWVTAWFTSHQTYKAQREDSSADDLDNLLDDLKVEATGYWSRGGQDASREERIVALSIRIADKRRRHDVKFNRGATKSDILRYSIALHCEVTGGPFATSRRIADPQRLRRVLAAIDKLRIDRT